MSGPTASLILSPRPALLTAGERGCLERRARLLAWVGNAWHLVEFGLAVGVGVAAGSIALVGFGADSLVEAFSGLVVVWLVTGRRRSSERAERRAQRLVAASFLLLGAAVGAESIRDLVGGDRPQASWVGIGLAAFTAPTMPLLARAKRDVGRRLGSVAVVSEGVQNLLCAYLSVALVLGLLLNALAGWWWADPAAALAVAAVALREGWQRRRGEACCDAC
ncbi:MAG TPA: cation transporter [Gaiellaceae bacterium]|nr:cation transporter [Gaiellaceae bacterium]